MRLARPSPAVVVATLALVVALAGTTYAAINVPANSVGTKQLKAGAVTASKIAKNAISDAKVAPDSLTGRSVNAGTLGEVPRAAVASSAQNANTLGGQPPSFYLPASSLVRIQPTVVDFGQIVTLFSDGPLLVRGQCSMIFNGSLVDNGSVMISSTKLAVFQTSQTAQTQLDTPTPATWGSAQNTADGDEFLGVSYGSASADDGTNLIASIAIALNPPGHFQQCVFSGTYVP
jgi:hypothetical protein